MMLYTKYKSYGPWSFGQEDFWNLNFQNQFLTTWPNNVTILNGLNNFFMGPPWDHSCEVWWINSEWFQRCFKKLLTHRRMDDGKWAITKAHLEHYLLRWGKKTQTMAITLVYYFIILYNYIYLFFSSHVKQYFTLSVEN